MIYEPIILIVIGIGALIIQMVYFLKDDRADNNSPKDKPYKLGWHAAGGVLHLWMGYVIGRMFGPAWGCLAGSLTWYFFDGFINSYVLSKEWWYIGTTAGLDKVQRWAAGILHIDPQLFSACLKHAALILSTLYLIPHLL